VKTEGAERLEGKGISYCAVCDGTFYKDKTVAVLGGGDTALDDACYLSDIAAKVYIIHRRDKFRGAKSTEELLRKKDNVAFLMNRKVTEISGDEKVTGVTLIPNNNPERNDIDPETERLPVDGIFVAYGSVPQTELLKGLAELDENGYVCAPESGETSCEGIYAAGDVRTKSLRQVSTAVSDGAYAAMTCADYIRNR
jgi:thioredoxin reductase (NADPH)